MKNKYLWHTDLHLGTVLPWTFLNFIKSSYKEKPNGIFLTGDISLGPFIPFHLSLMAKLIKCPIYFVLGNHDYYYSSVEATKDKIRSLCQKYNNLIWLSEKDIIALNSDVAIIGAEGWYDVNFTSYKYFHVTIDWLLIDEFRRMPSMKERVDAFKAMADESAAAIKEKLETAISRGYKKIYILTHFPPWIEATKNKNRRFFKALHSSYDVNVRLGKTIEEVMSQHKDVSATILTGHTHHDAWVQVAPNIECKVNSNKYYGLIRNEEFIFI